MSHSSEDNKVALYIRVDPKDKVKLNKIKAASGEDVAKFMRPYVKLAIRKETDKLRRQGITLE